MTNMEGNNISKLKKHTIVQLLMAVVFFFFILFFIELKYEVTIASLGAATLIVFVLPGSMAAHWRNMVVASVVAVVFGTIAYYIKGETLFGVSLTYSVLVGITAFVLIRLNAFHPPAAGYALGMAIDGFTWKLFLLLLTSIALLIIAHEIFGHYLMNLIEKRKIEKHELRKWRFTHQNITE